MRAVIFDLDNTLFPHERYVVGGFAAVARHVEATLGISAAQAFKTLVAARAEVPGHEFQRLAGAHRWPDTLAADLVEVFRSHVPSLWLFYDAAPVLQQLRGEGWRIGILTNGLPRVQRAKVQALGLAPHVDGIVFAEEHQAGGKPHRTVFQEMLRRLDLPAHRSVMVGDDPECDARGGRESGLRTIGIDRCRTGSWPCADIVLDSLAGVPAAAGALVEGVCARAA